MMNEKIPVLVIAYPCLKSGGAERWQFKVLETMYNNYSRFFELILAIPLDIKPGCIGDSIKVAHEHMIITLKGLLQYIRSVIRITKVIKRRNIGIIISGYQTPRIALLSFIASLLTNRPCFITFHMPLGWQPFFKNAKIRLRITDTIIFKLFEIINRKCHTIYVCKSLIYYHKLLNINIRNYSSLSGSAVPVKPKEHFINKQEWLFDIVYLASIAGHKGIFDIPIIVQKVREQIPNVKVAIIGRLNDSLREELLDSVRRRGLESNVFLLGYLDEEAKFQVLKQSKVMIYPSYMDTFAITVLEALSVGTPAIIYKIPIAVCYPTKAVVKVDVGNTEDFAKEVVKILVNEKIRDELSKDATRFANKLTWEKITKEFISTILKAYERRYE